MQGNKFKQSINQTKRRIVDINVGLQKSESDIGWL